MSRQKAQRDSINPFFDLPTALPTVANVTDDPTARRSDVSEVRIEKAGWKRVSSRQWVRDIRDFLKDHFGIPNVTVCKKFFVTSGYYPSMVKDDYYQKYVSKFPSTIKKESNMSIKSSLVSGRSITDSTMTTTGVSSYTTDNPSTDVESVVPKKNQRSFQSYKKEHKPGVSASAPTVLTKFVDGNTGGDGKERQNNKLSKDDDASSVGSDISDMSMASVASSRKPKKRHRAHHNSNDPTK